MAINDAVLDAVWQVVSAQLELPEAEKTRAMLREMLEALALFSRKQHDYSSVNILTCGEDGLFTRVTDKWARLWSYYRLGRQLKNESVEDTWRDMAVYSFIALLLRSGRWNLSQEELAALGLKEVA